MTAWLVIIGIWLILATYGAIVYVVIEAVAEKW